MPGVALVDVVAEAAVGAEALALEAVALFGLVEEGSGVVVALEFLESVGEEALLAVGAGEVGRVLPAEGGLVAHRIILRASQPDLRVARHRQAPITYTLLVILLEH